MERVNFDLRQGETLTLAGDPDILIMDEAVAALDESIQAQVVNLMMDLQEIPRASPPNEL